MATTKKIAATAEVFATSAPTAIDLSAASDEGSVVKIGIIGCGRIGQLHAANVSRLPNAKLVCVSDFFPKAAAACAAKFGVPMACQTHSDMLTHANVDAIIVCSPTDTHAEIIRDASAAGKHVFCEKPVDKSLAVIDELAKTVEAAGIKFFLGFQRRYDRHFLAARKARESGAIGAPVKLHLVSRDPSPPPIGYLKQSGGIFSDQSSHDFDMARFLVGSDIVEISAIAVATDPEIAAIDDYDHTLCSIKFANGCFGTIDNSRSSALGYDQRAELFGSKGSVFVDNVTPTTATHCNTEGVKTDNPEAFFMQRYADAYLEEVKDFVACVLEDKPVPCGIPDGRLPVIYAAAARKSVAEGRPIKIADIEVNGV